MAVGARCFPVGVVWGGVAVVVRRGRKRPWRAPFLSAFGGVAAAASPAACWLGGWGRRRPFPAPRGRCGAGGARLAALLLLCGVPVSFGPGDVAQMAFRLAPAQGGGRGGAAPPSPPLSCRGFAAAVVVVLACPPSGGEPLPRCPPSGVVPSLGGLGRRVAFA